MSYLGQLPGMQWCATKRRYFPLRPGGTAQSSYRYCNEASCNDCANTSGANRSASGSSSSSAAFVSSEGGEGVASVGDVPAHPKILQTLPRVTAKNASEMLRDLMRGKEGKSNGKGPHGKGGKRDRDNPKGGKRRPDKGCPKRDWNKTGVSAAAGKVSDVDQANDIRLDEIDCICAICSQEMKILRDFVDNFRNLSASREYSSASPVAKGSSSNAGPQSLTQSGDAARSRKHQRTDATTNVESNRSEEQNKNAEGNHPDAHASGTLADETLLYLSPTCQHIFHRACLDKWLKSKGHCPLCRLPVDAALYAAHQSSLQIGLENMFHNES